MLFENRQDAELLLRVVETRVARAGIALGAVGEVGSNDKGYEGRDCEGCSEQGRRLQ